ncbi:uncharacterized protein LOC111480699 [Cucurbita maxima]|uniref:Uncharacterized protein LOC111480699 n=1 Tax=Cucurbita maxima TaxID=3661 RepID=A0A6J1J030_CUCMA|nr:uncharacterized protein LOC111480699 [Cucurbita maxima]
MHTANRNPKMAWQSLYLPPPVKSVFSMNCITSAIELPVLRSHFKPNRRQRKQNNSQSQPPIYISPQSNRFASLTANAIPNSLVLANTIPPSQSGDVSVLLQTSGVLLIVYLIANFIVPEFIMKSYSTDESEGKALMEDEEIGASERRKKQGFGGNKR